MLHEINWPHPYLPGTTDNFASNEVIIQGVTAKEAFENLIDTAIWPTYYDNVSDVEFDNTKGTKLAADTRFRFKTFGFPIEAEITEFVAPKAISRGDFPGTAGRRRRGSPPRRHPRLAPRRPVGKPPAHPDPGIADWKTGSRTPPRPVGPDERRPPKLAPRPGSDLAGK